MLLVAPLLLTPLLLRCPCARRSDPVAIEEGTAADDDGDRVLLHWRRPLVAAAPQVPGELLRELQLGERRHRPERTRMTNGKTSPSGTSYFSGTNYKLRAEHH